MRPWWSPRVGALCAALVFWAAGTASARASLKSVSYRGDTVQVPSSWSVVDLAAHPTTCVRLDRAAVYLGTASANQNCPAHAVGRREAIVLGQSAAPPHTARPAADRPLAHAASAIYKGKGFDTCSAPSTRAMDAWSSSYHAIGIYVGGENSACAQPNLTPTWVSRETAAGWHLVPTYVGVQGAGACGGGCSTIARRRAAAEGIAAANDAVARVAALGIPAGNPIYYDMEGYDPSGSKAVLKFLSAWTSRLHALGYLSGVYSSGASGIADLAAAYPTHSMNEPDELWIADWNGAKTTSDPYVPASYWSKHQRIHQYSGGHDERHGHVTMNIDSDYLDAATADTQGTSSPPAGCVVPRLGHKTLRQARRTLRRNHCALGKVHRPAHKRKGRPRVVRQAPKAGSTESQGYPVDVTLRY